MPAQADNVCIYIYIFMYPFYRSAFPARPAATETAMFSKTGKKKSSLKKRESHPGAVLGSCVPEPQRHRSVSNEELGHCCSTRSSNALFSDLENGKSPLQDRNQGVRAGERFGFCIVSSGDEIWSDCKHPCLLPGERTGLVLPALANTSSSPCCRGPSQGCVITSSSPLFRAAVLSRSRIFPQGRASHSFALSANL